MQKFGLLVDRLGIDQLSYSIIKELNLAVECGMSPIVFFLEHCQVKDIPLFARMQAEQVCYFDAPVIATSLETANLLINSPCPNPKFFYLWNIGWAYQCGSFRQYHDIMQKLNIITRSESHSTLVKKCWLKDSHTVEDFNYEEIKQILFSDG